MFIAGTYFGIAHYLLPKIRALSESTHYMPYDSEYAEDSTAFNRGVAGGLEGYDNDSGAIIATSSEVKLGAADDWWNTSWEYKKALTITNLSNEPTPTLAPTPVEGEDPAAAKLAAGQQVSITVNTQDLVTAGKLQASCNDLRVVYSSDGTTFREIARSVSTEGSATDCSDSSATHVSFPLQADLEDQASSSDYYLFYGNDGAEEHSMPKEKYLSFDGVDDYVAISDNSTNNIGSSSYTIEAWVKSEKTNASIVSMYCGHSVILAIGESGKAFFRARGAVSGSVSDAVSDSLVNDGFYHHLAGVIDRNTETVNIYVDGDLEASSSYTGDDFGRTCNFEIGDSTAWGLENYSGLIDEVRFWDKALIEEEIQQRKDSEVSNQDPLLEHLVAYYQFNEGSGQTVVDSSSNSNDGTLGANDSAGDDDPTWVENGGSAYDITRDDGTIVNATLVCPFNGTTECIDGETPTTETGAIRYSGEKGSALIFDGAPQTKVAVSSNESLEITDNLTLEAWVYPTSYITPYPRILHKSNDYELVMYTYNGGEGRIEFSLTGADGLYCATSTDNSYIADLNKWTHVAGTYSDGVAKIFIDGVLARTRSCPEGFTEIRAISQSFVVGSIWGGEREFPGLIDGVRVSNTVRYEDNFDPSVTDLFSDEHTALLYHFDENGSDPRQPDVVIDASGNGNHGTINGAKYVSGLVGSDGARSPNSAHVGASTFASHQGIFIEEGTTNKVTNPSFEHTTWDTNWGLNYFNYDEDSATFTPKMAKRNSAGPFAAGVMVGGSSEGGSTSDKIIYPAGNQIADNFYSHDNSNQGSIVLWITPEWDGDDGKRHDILEPNPGVFLGKTTIGNLIFYSGGSLASVNISDWNAGNTYEVVLRWDTKNTLDGTNHVSISVDNIHSFDRSSSFEPWNADSTNVLGDNSTHGTSDAIIEGLTIYRRPLFDGTYGIDVGNGNEIEQIYNGGAGQDPTLVTGSWDVVFALPTNAETGTLGTGAAGEEVTGEAWTHPHADNVLYTDTTNTGGFMLGADYTADGWIQEASPPSVSNLVSDEKIYSGGYKWTSNDFNQGIKYTLTDLTPGQDYVIRAVANSGEGVGQPKIYIYDETNGHDITEFTGTVTSTRTSPDNMLFTFELPTVARYGGQPGYDWVNADTTSITIKLVNAAESGEVHFHQVELYENLIDNSSLEVGSGDPWVPDGWDNAGAESTETSMDITYIHSGSGSLKIKPVGTGYQSAAIQQANLSKTVGAFYSSGSLIYRKTGSDGGAGIAFPSAYRPGLTAQSIYGEGCSYCRGSGLGVSSTNSELEQKFKINRANATGSTVTMRVSETGYGGESYFDDIYHFQLTPVSLTVTPATQTNSTESTGLRVDGADTLTQSINNLSADRGILKFQFTPRHSQDSMANFGFSKPVIGEFYVASQNRDNPQDSVYIEVINDADIRFVHRANWINKLSSLCELPNPFVAGQTYNVQYQYDTNMDTASLNIDGAEVCTLETELDNFSQAPDEVSWGGNALGSDHIDATFSNFESLTPSENTGSAYSKFAGSSAQLVNAGSLADQYTITLDPDSTATHTLSAYVYSSTDGSVGGTVDSSVAELYYNSAAITTEYEDTGGGWWRLTGQVTPIDASREYGVEVKAGKSVYVDGVQLEQKAYATTYADGSLGEGYSWSGQANENSSLRDNPSLIYDSMGNLSVQEGSYSFWFKPDWDYDYRESEVGTHRFFIVQKDANNHLTLQYATNSKRFSLGRRVGGTSHSALKSLASFEKNDWIHVLATWDTTEGLKLYLNNGTPGTNSNTDFFNNTGSFYLSSAHSNSTISDLRIFDSALTESEVADLYYQGLSTHSSSTEEADRFQETGTYTSPVIDLNANGGWGNTPVAFTDTADGTNGTINYFTRTSTDNSTWGNWTAIDGTSINSDARPYFQWKAEFDSSASSQAQSPSITNMTLNYVEDTTPPDNPDITALGFSDNQQTEADLTSGEWHNFANPKFSWDPALDEAATGQSSSGINGYHVLLTTDDTATPTDHTGADCYSWVLDNEEDGGEITIGTDPASCSLSDNIYYLRVQTKDKAGNIADPVTLFTYKYDATIPGVPASVSSTTVGFSANNDFDFYWPPAVDVGGSGIAYYEYKTGSTDPEDPFSQWQATTGPDDRLAQAVTAYTEGQNLFYVRTIDHAGNYSATTSNVAASPFYYNESAPTEPTNLQITPATTSDNPATSNVFTVTWEEPESFSGDISKYYYCVNCTPSATTMTETTASETVSLTLQDMALATQQGKNTLYLVAEDNNINAETGHGNRNFDAHATIDFYASTTAPAAPQNLSISDSSDRNNETWRLTLAWNEAAEEDGVDHYNVYRSDDEGETYTNIGNVSSEAYTDTNLTFEKSYYYKVTSIDNAGSESLASNVVSELPVGKYTNPPSAGGTPSAKVGSSTATITWSTSRDAYGTVEYGKSTDYGSSAAESVATGSHSVKLTGLAPGQSYHYRVHSLDESSLVGYDRSLAYSDDYTFTTLTQADISDVQVTDIGLDSAVVTWDTSSLASSQVDYGLTTEYGETVQVSTTPDESTHTARLANLEHSTKYHFRIQGVTADETDIFSEDYSFETITFPEITATLLNTDQAAAGATIVLAWATNVPTTGTIDYQPAQLDVNSAPDEYVANTDQGKAADLDALQGLTSEELAQLPVIPAGETSSLYQGESADKHVQRITGLEDGSIYIFTIRGKDEYGNETISDPIRYVTGADTRPPRILNQIIETPIKGAGTEAKSQIIVSFETDEPAYSQILWGQGSGTEYPQASEKSPEPTTKHVIVLRDLDPTTTYHLKIEAEDDSGNKAETEDTIVVTPTAQQAAFDIVLKNLEDVFGFLRL